VDLTSFAKDGSTRYVRSYRAIPYNLSRGSAMGYMPELNVLCPIGDYSAESDQPLMKHLVVEIKPSKPAAAESRRGHSTICTKLYVKARTLSIHSAAACRIRTRHNPWMYSDMRWGDASSVWASIASARVRSLIAKALTPWRSISFLSRLNSRLAVVRLLNVFANPSTPWPRNGELPVGARAYSARS